MKKRPYLKINFNAATRMKMNDEIGADTLLSNGERRDAVALYMYNFWDTTFRLDTGEWKGEDLSFCALARGAGFKLYAHLDSWTTHHGSRGWKGRFGDFLVQKKAEQWQKCGKRQILYMQLKKNKNKKKNYYRKSVFLYKWLRSVGIYD